jgi:glycerol-3-phosphate dehydrogenase
MPRSETLLIEWLRWAVALGGAALSRMRAVRLTREGRRVTGVIAEDGITGDAVPFRAHRIVNAAGPLCRELAATADRDRPELFHPSLAFNLLLDQPPPAGKTAVAVEPGGMGTLFLHPYQGRILVGTRHLPHRGPLSRPAAAQVPDAAVDAVLAALNRAFPGMRLTRDAVVERRAGYLPAVAPGSEIQAKRPVVVDHGAAGGPAGLYSLSGVKWTTARALAASFFKGLGLAEPADLSARPGRGAAPELSAEAFLALPDAEARRWLAGMQHETAALTVEDVLERRTGWSADPRHGAAVAERLAHLWPSPAAAAGPLVSGEHA